ncbi:MAG: hypothetical protein HY903_05515 [Deltaproteobacteria bacterium]|nr:hypothetical protein [Deltaproteobacteria bacterium]
MALIAFNWNPDAAQLRWFGLLWLPLFFAAVAFVLMTRLAMPDAWTILAPLALLSAILGAMTPQTLKPVFVGLLLLTFPIGFVVSHLVMFALFFFVVTPVGLGMRLFGRDALRLRFENKAMSYWIKRPAKSPIHRYFRQF